MRITANGLAAVPIIRKQFRFVADTDLPHFDSRAQLARQHFHQLPKVNALFRQVVNHDALSAKDLFDVHKLHVEAQLVDMFADVFHELIAIGFDRSEVRSILISEEPKNTSDRRIVQM